MRVDDGLGGVGVTDVDVAAEPRCPPLRVPHVLIGCDRAPYPGHLDIGSGVEDPVGQPTDPDAGRGVVDLQAGADAGAEAGGAFRVAGVGADHIVARKVQLASHRERPAKLVGRMAVGDVVRCAVVGAAGVVKRAADAREAPGLIDAQVGDDIGQAEAVERRVLIGERGVAGHGSIDAECGCIGIHGRGAVVTPGVLERQRAGDAAAERGAIGP